MSKKDSNVEGVIIQLREREQRGFRKYGNNTDRTDLSTLEWLQHLQEELMDGCVYIEKIKSEMSTPKKTESDTWTADGIPHWTPDMELKDDDDVEHQKMMKARDNYNKRMYLEVEEGDGDRIRRVTEDPVDQGDYEYSPNPDSTPQHIKIPTDDD